MLRSFELSVENNDQTNDRPSLPATLVRRTPPNYYVTRDADGQRAELCLFRLLAQKPTSRPHCDTKCSQRLAMLHFEGDQNPFTLTSPSSSPVGAFFNEGTPLPAALVFRRLGSLFMMQFWRAIYENKARCRHFHSYNTGACSRATEWSAAKRTEANKGGCSKRRPDNHQR